MIDGSGDAPNVVRGDDSYWLAGARMPAPFIRLAQVIHGTRSVVWPSGINGPGQSNRQC